MRQVSKGKPLDEYIQYLKHSDIKDWKELSGGIKGKVAKHILLFEQNMLSAYTEKLLSCETNGLHVDHFIKQQFLTPGETLQWDNFFVDVHVGSEMYGADFKDNSKYSSVNSKDKNLRVINPAMEDPHHYFYYTTQGEIIPRADLDEDEKERALLTTTAFNLNHPSLVEELHNVYMQIKSLKQGKLTADEIKSYLIVLPYEYSYPSVIEYFCEECFDSL